MFLNKIKLFLVISICLIFFFLTYNDVKSYEIKIIDGDTIHLNGKKIRFSGIDTPELKQTCKKNDKIIYCGIKAKKLLIDKKRNKLKNFSNENIEISNNLNTKINNRNINKSEMIDVMQNTIIKSDLSKLHNYEDEQIDSFIKENN